MKITFTGEQLAATRKAWGFDVRTIAAVFHVHPGTVERWESSQSVPVDGLPAQLYLLLRNKKPEHKAGFWIHAIVATCGTLAALQFLIEQLRGAEDATP